MEGEQTSIPGSEAQAPRFDPAVPTALAARVRMREAEWVVSMANRHKMPVPQLAGLLIENAIEACRQTPALIGEILRSKESR